MFLRWFEEDLSSDNIKKFPHYRYNLVRKLNDFTIFSYMIPGKVAIDVLKDYEKQKAEDKTPTFKGSDI